MNTKVIDFHTHIFPDKLAPKAIAALEHSGGVKAATQGTKESLKRSMTQGGVDFSLNLPIASRPDQVQSINQFAIALNQEGLSLREQGGGILSFGAIHPLYEDWKQELRRLQSAGIKGIKLHPDFQGFFLDDEPMVAVMEEAASLGLMILIHCGMDVSFPDIHRSTPERLHRILPRLQGATIIAAHLGGYRYLDDVERLLVGSDVYIDTSFTIGQFDEGQIKRILQNHRPDHILFGTDSPWEDQGKAVAALRALGLPASLEQAILWENGAKLLGL